MKKSKKWFAVVVAGALMASVLAGCSVDEKTSESGTAQEETNQGDGEGTVTKSDKEGSFKIGIAAREITNDYNRSIVSAAQKMIEDAGGSVVIADAQSDVQKHNENIENLINSGIDGLIVHLGDPEQMASLMEEAEKKGNSGYYEWSRFAGCPYTG